MYSKTIVIAFLFFFGCKSSTSPMDETNPVPVDGRGGGITAFYSERDDDSEIYIMNGDGSGETKLTNNTFQDLAPDLSPDGSQIVFISNRDGNSDIYKINRDGSNIIRLANTAAEDAYPYFSPDGLKIIYCSKQGGNWEVYLMNSDGTDQTRITNNSVNDEWAHLSPDMNTIVYSVGDFPDYNIYTMNIDGSNQTELLSSPNLLAIPKWSRTGDEIAYNNATFNQGVFKGNVFIMNADGTDSRKVTTNDDSYVNEYPYWSPDNQKIVFQSNESGNFQIYTIHADGSNRTRLTSHGGNDYWPSWASLSD